MFVIRDEYGSRIKGGAYESYDLACRVAHFVRKLHGFEIFVVDTCTGRATSEVHYSNLDLDLWACSEAKRLFAGDYESRMID